MQPSATKAVDRRTIFFLVLLSAVSFFNYMDRMVLAVLLEPIKSDLQLTDSQLGWLSGPAFAIVYAMAGIPLARAADRMSRVWLLSMCLAVWSVMTAATGAARSFAQIFVMRMGVGIGEGGCIPASHSLIGDYLGPERRPLGISLFQAGGTAGVSAGLVFAGLLADQFGWRLAMMIVGLAGLPLAVAIVLLMREPPRASVAHSRAHGETALTASKALLSRPAMRQLLFALSVAGIGTYGIGQWLPTFFIRSHGLSLSQVGIWSGLTSGAGGICGVMLGAIVAIRLIRRDHRWELWFPAACYALTFPFYLMTFTLGSVGAALIAKFFAVFLSSAGGGVALSALQSFAEPNRRATAVALVLLFSSFTGLGLGPLVIGAASQWLEAVAGRDSLRYALIVATICYLWCATHFYFSGRRSPVDRVS